MSNKSTGLKTIAYALDLSINTVSRALRDCDDISEATKELVRQKAYELGYQTNSLSQFLKRDDRLLVAVIVNGLDNYFFVTVAQKLILMMQQENYDFAIIVGNADIGNADLIKQCISQRADGIITLINLDEKAQEAARFANIPIVSYGANKDCSWMDQVITDDKSGCSLAARYLINFHHLHKLYYICPTGVLRTGGRYQNFKNAIRDIDPSITTETIYINEVEEKVPPLLELGDCGFFAFNDNTAYRALESLNAIIPNIRRIYKSFHIVGYDAVSLRMTGLIDLTSINYDYDQMCQLAFSLLKKRIKDPSKASEVITVPVKLHQRKIV